MIEGIKIPQFESAPRDQGTQGTTPQSEPRTEASQTPTRQQRREALAAARAAPKAPALGTSTEGLNLPVQEQKTVIGTEKPASIQPITSVDLEERQTSQSTTSQFESDTDAGKTEEKHLSIRQQRREALAAARNPVVSKIPLEESNLQVAEPETILEGSTKEIGTLGSDVNMPVVAEDAMRGLQLPQQPGVVHQAVVPSIAPTPLPASLPSHELSRPQVKEMEAGEVYAYAGKTEVGKHRPENEDSFYMGKVLLEGGVDSGERLFIVADGVGGHAAGEVASEMAVNGIVRENQQLRIQLEGELRNENGISEQDRLNYIKNRFQIAIERTNEQIFEYFKGRNEVGGTTVNACLALPGGKYFLANVGDSRTYSLRKSGLLRETTDNSQVQKLVEAGIIEADDVYTHPARNIILRSLGTNAGVEVDTYQGQLQPGESLLLCCDGLWEEVRDEKIQDILTRASNPTVAVNVLVQTANDNGGRDNITAIVVKRNENDQQQEKKAPTQSQPKTGNQLTSMETEATLKARQERLAQAYAQGIQAITQLRLLSLYPDPPTTFYLLYQALQPWGMFSREDTQYRESDRALYQSIYNVLDIMNRHSDSVSTDQMVDELRYNSEELKNLADRYDREEEYLNSLNKKSMVSVLSSASIQTSTNASELSASVRAGSKEKDKEQELLEQALLVGSSVMRIGARSERSLNLSSAMFVGEQPYNFNTNYGPSYPSEWYEYDLRRTLPINYKGVAREGGNRTLENNGAREFVIIAPATRDEWRREKVMKVRNKKGIMGKIAGGTETYTAEELKIVGKTPATMIELVTGGADESAFVLMYHAKGTDDPNNAELDMQFLFPDYLRAEIVDAIQTKNPTFVRKLVEAFVRKKYSRDFIRDTWDAFGRPPWKAWDLGLNQMCFVNTIAEPDAVITTLEEAEPYIIPFRTTGDIDHPESYKAILSRNAA